MTGTGFCSCCGIRKSRSSQVHSRPPACTRCWICSPSKAGGSDALRQHPRAIFDVCPSPPLNWSEFASQNLVDLARAGVPAEIVSMPLAGATAPVTLAGSVVQHAAECISGITIHQLATARSAHRLGRRSRHLRYAHGKNSHGCNRDRHARCGLRRGREISRSADTRIHGRRATAASSMHRSKWRAAFPPCSEPWRAST